MNRVRNSAARLCVALSICAVAAIAMRIVTYTVPVESVTASSYHAKEFGPQKIADHSTAEVDCWLMPLRRTGWVQMNFGRRYWIRSVRILNTHYNTAYGAVTCQAVRIDGPSNEQAFCHGVLPQYRVWTSLVVNANARAIRIDVESTLPAGGGLNEVVIKGRNGALDVVVGAVILVAALLIIVGGMRVMDVCAAVLFGLVIVVPHVDKVWHVFPTAENTEKRRLAPCPQFNRSSNVYAFATDCEAYVNDHFGMRDLLIHAHATMQVKLWKRSPVASELIGLDGWLFHDHHGLIDDFRGLRLYTEDELRTIKRNMERERDIMRAHGAPYFILIGPNKSTIYPEYLPHTVRRYRAVTRFDQMADYLRQHSDINLIDIRPALRQAKTSYPVYYKTDLHWNNFGGFVAYREIMRQLSHVYPRVTPLSMEDMQIAVVTNKGYGSDSYAMNTPGMWEDYAITVIPRYAAGTNHYRIPKLLIFSDSFIAAVMPLLRHDFDNIVVQDNHRRGTTGWRDHDSQVVEREKPDVVLYESAEYVQNWLR